MPVFDGRGYPTHGRGVTSCPGLYFLGLPWQHTWGSGRFAGVAPGRGVPGRPHRRRAPARRRLRRAHRRPRVTGRRASRAAEGADRRDDATDLRRAPPPRRAARLPLLRRTAGQPRHHRARHHRRADRRPRRRGHRTRPGHPQLRRPGPGRRLLLQRAGASRPPRPTTGSAPALWVSPAPAGRRERTAKALALAGEARRAGAEAQLPARRPRQPTRPAAPRWTGSSRAAQRHDLVVHVHTSPGAASDIDEVGQLVERYADRRRRSTWCTSAAA